MKNITTIISIIFHILLCDVYGAENEKAQNIVLIVIESLRQDHMSCYGYSRETTPAIDSIAKEGVRFTHTIAASSWTTPSLMSIFTSLYPSVHHVKTAFDILPDNITTLAQELKSAGYQTVAITFNPCSSSKYGFDKGFDIFDDTTIYLADEMNTLDINNIHTSDKITKYALKWLKRRKSNMPFFLFLFYFDPHYDYTPPPPYNNFFVDPAYIGKADGKGILQLEGQSLSEDEKKHIVDLYDGEIRFTDEQIKILFEGFKQMDLLKNTVFIITSDHGEEFWDHNGIAHGHTLYDELIRVPLIISSPAQQQSGIIISQLVSHIDIMPTILELASIKTPNQCSGQSLVPLFSHCSTNIFLEKPVFSETECKNDLKAIRTTTAKLIEDVKKRTFSFYLLDKDPDEKYNIKEYDNCNLAKDIFRMYEEWKDELEKLGRVYIKKTPSNKIDQKTIKQLKSLGYVQ